MPDLFKQQSSEIDSLIKTGQWRKAQKALVNLKRRKLPREILVDFAALCRRANYPGLGISVLRPVIYSNSKKLDATVTAAEKVEYAYCLIRVGANQEARHLLSDPLLQGSAEIVAILATLHIKDWNYPAAIPLFCRFLQVKELSEYSRRTGQLNLASCLLFEGKVSEAQTLTTEVLASALFMSHAIFAGTALRLAGTVAFELGEYEAAVAHFEKSYEQFPESNLVDRFLTRKWMGITHFVLSNGDKPSIDEIQDLYREATTWKNWESIRDLDFHIACHRKDEKKLAHLFYGTPYRSYKKKIEGRFTDLTIPENYEWRLGKSPTPQGKTKAKAKPKKAPVIDWSQAKSRPPEPIQCLLSILTSDFYRPFGLVELFEKLFQGEFYQSEKSEKNVYQLVLRAQKWLKKTKTPLTVEYNNDGVQLKETSPCTILVRQGGNLMDQISNLLHNFQAAI